MLVLAFVCGSVARVASAQEGFRPSERLPEAPTFQTDERDDPLALPPIRRPPNRLDGPDRELRVRVSSISIIGATAIPDEELRAVVAPSIDRALGTADLIGVVEAAPNVAEPPTISYSQTT